MSTQSKNIFLIARVFFAILILSLGMNWIALNHSLTDSEGSGEVIRASREGLNKALMYGLAIASFVASFFVKKFFLLMKGGNPEGKQLIGTLLACSMCESAALFGLILAQSTQQISDFYSLAALALFGLLYHFPRADNWQLGQESGG